MKRILKNITGILFIFLFLAGEISLGATIISTRLSEGQFTGGDDVLWSATNHYIEEIEVMRDFKGEAFSVTIPEGPLMRGWHTAGNRNEYQRFNQVTNVENPEITFFYGGSLQVRDYQSQNYNVKNTGVNGDTITMELQSKKDSDDRPTYYGNRTISVPGSVPDGRYIITSTVALIGTGKLDVQVGHLIIKTLPSVSIRDIDFRDHRVGERVNLTESSPIEIRNGSAGERFTLFIEGIEGATGGNRGETYILLLTNSNSSENIPVQLSITGLDQNPVLGSGGDADAQLNARIEGDLPSTHGTYSGRAKIVFQYD